MPDNKLKIEVEVQPEAFISDKDIRNFQKTVALALKDLRVPASTIRQVTGLGENVVKQVLGDTGEFQKGIKAYSEALQKLANLPFERGRGRQEAEEDFRARQRQAQEQRKKEIKEVERLFATEAQTFGRGQQKLIQEASQATNKALRTNLLRLSDSYKQSLRIVNREIERSAEFKKGLDLIQATGLDDKALAELKKGELDAIRVVREVSARVAKEIRATQDKIARTSKAVGADAPEVLLTSLGLSAQQIKEFETRATRAINAQDRIARQVARRRARVRETEVFLQPLEQPPEVGAVRAARAAPAERPPAPDRKQQALQRDLAAAVERVALFPPRPGATPQALIADVAKELGVGLEEFKDFLVEARRRGDVTLGRADLGPSYPGRDVQRRLAESTIEALGAQVQKITGVRPGVRAPAGEPRREPTAAELDRALDRAFIRAGGAIGGRGVDIDRLRSELTSLTQAQQEQTLRRVATDRRGVLTQVDPAALRREARDAALRIAGEDVHRVYLDAAAKGAERVAAEAEKVVAKATGAPPGVPPTRPPVAAAAAPAPAPRPGQPPESVADLKTRIAGLKQREKVLREILNLEELTEQEREDYNRQLLETRKILKQIGDQEKQLSQQQRQAETQARKAQEQELKRARQRQEILARVQRARTLLSKDVGLFTAEDQREAVQLREELGRTAQEINKGRNELGFSVEESQRLAKIWADLKIRQVEITRAQQQRARLDREQQANARKEEQRLVRQRELLEDVNREAERFAGIRGADVKLLDPASVRLQKKEVQSYSAALNKLEKELKQDAQAAQRLGVTMEEVRQRKLEALRVTEALDQRLGRLSGRFNDFSQVLRQFLRYAIGYGGLFQLLNIFQQLGRSIVDLQQDLKGIQAVTAATEQDMIGISRAIADVAVSTRFSVREISQAAQLLGQAGVTASDLQGVLQATANFASAVGANLETAADLVTTFRRVYSELSETVIADQLTTAVNISKLAAEDLKTILSLSAQTARGYQLTSEQYLAAVTTLRNAGIKASTVATGLRQALIEIFSPDNRTIQILQARYAELGEILSGEQIRARFFEIQQERNPLTAALRELERLGISGGAERQFGRIFDVRAINVIRALIKDIGQLESDAATLSFGGSAAKAATTQLEALNAQVVNLGAAFTTFGFQLAEGPLETLTELTKAATDSIVALSKLDLELKAIGGEGLGEKVTTGLLAGLGVGAFARGGFGRRLAAGAAAGSGVAVAEISAAGDNVGGFLAGLGAVFAGISLATERSTKEVDTLDKLRETNASKARVAFTGFRFALTRLFTGWIGWLLLAWEAFDALSDYIDAETTSFEKIERSAIAAAKASQAATAKFERDFQDFENIRLTSAGQESAAGTAARSLEDLQTRFEVQAQELAAFVQGLGGATQEQTDQVRDILREFSTRARAGEAGTRAREALRSRIAEVLGVRAEVLQQLDFQLNALLAEEGDINRFTQRYLESFRRAIDDAKAAGEEATETQKALLQSYEQLTPEEIVELTSLAGQAREGTVDLIEQVLQRANDLVEAEIGRRREGEISSRFERQLSTTAEYLAQLQQEGRTADFQRTINAFVEANAGVVGTWQEVYDQLIAQLNEISSQAVRRAERGIAERALETAAGISPLAFAAPAFSQAREAGRTQQFEAAQRRQTGAQEAERLVRESQESYARGIAQANQARLAELEGHYEDMESLQDQERRTYERAVRLLPQQFRERIEAFRREGAAGGLSGFLVADEGGRQRISAELQRALEAWTDSIIKARTEFEADQKRLRQERLAAITTQKFVVEQELKDAKARGDEYQKIEALIRQRTALQVEENELKTKELEGAAGFDEKSKQLRQDNLRLQQQQSVQLRDELRLSQQRVARLKQQEAEFAATQTQDDALAAAFRGQQREAFDLAIEALNQRVGALDAERETAELIQDRRERELRLAQLAEEELSLNQDALQLRAELVDTLNRELAFRAQTGTSRQGAVELARFQAAGGRLTGEQRGELTQGRIEALREQDQLLAERVRLQQEIITNENDSATAQQRLYELELQRFEVQKQMAELAGQEQLRRQGIIGDLSQALNPEQLRSRLEEMNSGFNNLANTIQNKLVTGVDSFAGGLANAITTGKNLGQTLKATFQQTAQSITQAILKAVILKALLAATGGSGGFLAGLIGGASGGGGGAQGAATGATVTDAGRLEKSSSSGGGTVKGPAGRDNILAALKTPAGKLVEPIGIEAGEAILNRRATSLLGSDFIHKLNRGVLKGFAQGGLVNPRDVAPRRQTVASQVNVEPQMPPIVNVLDPSLVGDYLQTPDGEQAVVNVIERNDSSIKTFIG